MSEPISSGAMAVSSSAVVTASMVTLITGIDAGVLYGALAGSTLYVVTSHDLSIFRQIIYMVISTVLAVISAQFMADLLGFLCQKLGATFVVPPGVGAAFAGATLVNILLWLIERSRRPGDFIQAGVEVLRGKR